MKPSHLSIIHDRAMREIDNQVALDRDQFLTVAIYGCGLRQTDVYRCIHLHNPSVGDVTYLTRKRHNVYVIALCLVSYKAPMSVKTVAATRT